MKFPIFSGKSEVKATADYTIADAELTRSIARRRREQWLIVWLLRLAALISVLTTVGIVVILIQQSIGFFIEISIFEFLTGLTWTPVARDPQYQNFGVVPLVVGTLLVSFIAGIIALVFGLGSATFISEYAPEKVRSIIKPLLEILAGIPTVVYGYFALLFVTPIIRSIFGADNVLVFNALSAGLVMGLMIMPTVSTLSEDAMYVVPKSLRDASYALGSTRFETTSRVVLPAAISGIAASFVLGISRAIGETMIVTIAAGARPQVTFNPFDSIQAMTAYIVQVSQGETPQGSLEYRTLFAVGLLLFVMTLFMNMLGRWFVSRFRQRYE